MKRNSLMCVKSIITVCVVTTLCVLTCMYPELYCDTFKSVVTMVATFYFTHQINKKEENTTKTIGDENDEISKGL